MPYSKSNKEIQDSAFKLKSGNTTPFKQMGSSPLKQKPIPTTGKESYKEYLNRAFKASKSPEGKDVMGKKGWKKGWQKSFDKWMGKLGTKGANKALTTVGMYFGSMKAATATQPGTGKHGGTKTGTYNPKTEKYE